MNMIPQIAYHPRHPSQQFGSTGFATPTFEPLPTPRRPDRLAPLPFRSSRNRTASSPLAPPQRAYPAENYDAHRPSLVRDNAAGHSFGGQYDDPSEHMLRRKTPNGTLAAGYDGTPVQWSSKAPALKHVVLPMSETCSGQHGGYLSSTADHPRNRRRSGSSGWHYQQPATQIGGFNFLDGEMRMISEPVNWTQLPPISDPSNNVWDHIRKYQAITYYPNNDMQVPTVLQPAYQPSPGPTASNDGGLYGPYWPDGKFVPYRPAAIREQGHLNPNRAIYDFNRGPEQYSQTRTELLPPFRQPSFNSNVLQRSGNAPHSSPDSVLRYSEDRYSSLSQSHSHLPNINLYSSISDGSRTPTAQSTNRTSNPRFKEKTLSWAHSIYVDLLAFIHQSRKENRQSRHSGGFRTYSKNSIYPKPPRQPSSSIGSSHWGDFNDEATGRNPRSHSGNMIASPHRTTGSFNSIGWQAAHGQVESWHHGKSNQDVPHYISPFQASHPHASSPMNKAKEALEMLTTLCDQSGWCWIDGMLLGGCLAYGLEDYHKALDWYSKIIALDPE